MTTDTQEHNLPDEQHCDQASSLSAMYVIALGTFLGTAPVIAAEFWLSRHIRVDSFVFTAIILASCISANRLQLARYLGVLVLLAGVALLCGITADFAAEKLNWPATALVAIGGMSGGLIAVTSVAIRAYLSK